MFCDFHTHLHQYKEDEECLNQLITHQILSIACSIDDSSYIKTKNLKQGNPWIIPTYGIHPGYCSNEFDEKSFTKYTSESPIIGEIGLDFFWVNTIRPKVQIQVFERFLEHCNSKEKYCVIHTKGAEDLVLEILRGFPHAKPIIHWYSGPVDTYKTMLDLGYMFTFGCELKYSEHIRQLLHMTPLSQVLSETDNPESEQWLGGTRRDPLLIESVLTEIAIQKNMSIHECNQVILQNSFHILRESGLDFPQP